MPFRYYLAEPNGTARNINILCLSTLAKFLLVNVILLSLQYTTTTTALPFSAATANSFSNDDEFLTSKFILSNNENITEFPSLEGRGKKKFGDKCENTMECGYYWGVCSSSLHTCQCDSEHPVTNHIDKCGKAAFVNESCYFNEQCEAKLLVTECRDSKCVCRFDLTPLINKDGRVECGTINEPKPDLTYVDPAMIGVLVAMAVMFIIICVVLRLFANARWRENRTIFNTPNPRLMNVSLLRDSKILHERRGSRGSVRGPSRQPSMASLRPHSPNSQGSQQGSRGSSNASAISVHSMYNKNLKDDGNVGSTFLDAAGNEINTNTPMLENVTIEAHHPKA